MKRFRILSILVMTMVTLPLMAQSEAGTMLELGVEKKLSKKVSIGLDAEWRTRNDCKTTDRWSVGIGADYKPIKNIKLVAGYVLLNDHFREDISYNADGSYNNWRPSYWGVRHRIHASVTGNYKIAKCLNISLRERWQYTYRPETTVNRWDFDNSWWEDKVREAKGKNQLRSRLQIEYDKKHALLVPYASVELYNSWAIEKIRYTVGTNIALSKQHTLSIYYRYENMQNVAVDKYNPDMHYVGAGYKFKF